ncbi:MFS transporter [Bermanella marisrubri]|uniref:MFS transporter n=1 Tax=Bermanella marisrubri TaxID=207949 RepID=Q1N2D6_9GAMM|nr:MFS transporter [Bermanella marisrubri]EAT12471.1 hypothetical protein RED65_16576 [Oceanobacter sp. RED65] [Bermanella marisrubri]QIZ85549.1 MFS transporter [Bermanella marisrubri]
MKLKHALILLTLVSVVADTMLLPFYPQFFKEAFNYVSAQHVGYYIAACCITVMCAFPLWARLARYINELHLWVYTQIIAGCLGIACFYSSSLLEFWIVSQGMLVFKASYLLIYPYVMRLEENDQHLGIVGLFAVLMHFGAIGGAVLGGFTLEFLNAKDLYLIMAASDGLQVLVCLYLIIRYKTPFKQVKSIEKQHEVQSGDSIFGFTPTIFSVGVLTLLFYFSAFLIRPFFTQFWQSIQTNPWLASELISSFVYAIPAWIAVIGLWINHKNTSCKTHPRIIAESLVIGMLGLFIQAQPDSIAVILGRIIFAWALFQVSVRLEIILFENSRPERYGEDFSKVHFMQNIGIIISSFTVGNLVHGLGIQWAFYLAILGFALTLIFLLLYFRSNMSNPTSLHQSIENG